MQIVCPDCTTSYEISESALGPAGRMVRCAHCSHQWFAQAPEFAMSEMASGRAPIDPRVEAARFEAPARDDSRFDIEFSGSPRGVGSDPAPPSWSDPVAQWSAPPIPPEDVIQFRPSDDLVEFAPPSEAPAVDDAPALAPGEVDEAGTDGWTAPESAGDGEQSPDHFGPQRRRLSRTRGKKGKKAGLVTPPRLAAALAAVLALLIFERYTIVRMMPQTAALYAAVGLPINLRGLVFEDVTTATEMQDGVPVLVIEGVIHNVTKHDVDVPRLRFAMRNNAGADIYSWTAMPERAQLTPGGVMGFRSRLASPPAESRSAYVRFVQRRDLVSASR
jgi:predicted Zn finger-like uncharacterized protein